MFDIEYKGANSVVITTKKAVFVFDPKLSIAGLKDLSLKDAIGVATEPRLAVNDTQARLLIEGPGEYGISEVDIKGIPAQRHLDAESDGLNTTIYSLSIGDVKVVVLGNIYEKLSDVQLEEIGVTDVLIVPVGGGGYTLDPTTAASVTRLIDPKVVIPVHYNDKALKYEVSQADLSEFVKELNVPQESTPKFKYKKPSDLPASMTIYEVSRTS